VALTQPERGSGAAAKAAAGPTPAALKSRALRWLAQRDHSRAELERKLLTHARALARLAEAAGGDDDGAAAHEPMALFPDSLLRERVATALEALAAAGLLNEPRMAEALLAAKSPRLGARRLRQVMQQRGLAPELVEQALRQAGGSELERARALWQRRFDGPPANAAEQARQMRFLAGRGFDGETIRRVVRPGPRDEPPVADADPPHEPD
jgi:regulatory protein